MKSGTVSRQVQSKYGNHPYGEWSKIVVSAPVSNPILLPFFSLLVGSYKFHPELLPISPAHQIKWLVQLIHKPKRKTKRAFWLVGKHLFQALKSSLKKKHTHTKDFLFFAKASNISWNQPERHSLGHKGASVQVILQSEAKHK